jgi:uncharacterized protein (DUF2062 family)
VPETTVLKFIHRKIIKPIFTINDTPHSIALGVAFGMFVALTPTVGFQMLTVAIVGTLIKANRIIGLILCWISNPITMIPMYYGYYWLGGKLLTIETWTFHNFSSKIDGLMSVKNELGYFAFMEQLGHEILLPLCAGSLIIAVVLSAPLYPIVLYFLLNHRKENKSDSNGSNLLEKEKAPAMASPEERVKKTCTSRCP